MKTVTAACDVEAEIDANALKPKAAVSQLLFDAGFIASVKQLLELLNPVAKLTNYCQKSTTSIYGYNCLKMQTCVNSLNIAAKKAMFSILYR